MTAKIPVIDISDWFSDDQLAGRKLAEQVGLACHEKGFFYVKNHGIDEHECQRYMQALKAFFALPISTKKSIDKHHSRQFRGWDQLGSELTNNITDYREQLDIGVDSEAIISPDPYFLALVGPNQWLPEEILPGFRTIVVDFQRKLSRLSVCLLEMMSVALGLDTQHINRVFGKSPSPYSKLIRYPITKPNSQGVGIHKDSGFLTLLLQDDTPGLKAQATDGSWYEVEPIAGSFVVNIGELLQLMSGNYFVAAPHCVSNAGRVTRYSSAFFYSPDLTTRLEPLPISDEKRDQVAMSEAHRNAGLMASKTEMEQGVGSMNSLQNPTVFGEKYWQRWVRSYPDIAARFYPDNII